MSFKSNATLLLCFSLGTSVSFVVHGQQGNYSPGSDFSRTSRLGEVPPVSSLVVERVDDSKLVRLLGNTHPKAHNEFDKGLVDPQLPMEHMILVLKRSPEQEAALKAFMAGQLDPKSPDFHHWLQPREFGEIYGPSDADLSAVTNWLQNHGFSVDNVSKGRTFIEFSGTARLVQEAFHTEIHRYEVRGEKHIANNSDPSIPEALSPVVYGILSLSDFFTRPLHSDPRIFHHAANTGKWQPDNPDLLLKPMFGVNYGGTEYELVSPFDFATIYNVLPLWNAGNDGTGQTIAIAGRSDINLSDIATFRSAFGLPANAPTVIVNGADPGEPSVDDRVENTLDVEWAGAVAKGATIKFVTTASTTTTDGAIQSALYIIDNDVAPIMSFSYGECELALGTSGNAAMNAMWQEGAAAGITEFVASGDQGAAGCDGGQASPYLPMYGLAVSGTASTPYNVAVGGTDFQWPNLAGTYWSSSNNGTNLSSALGYIPEVPWNGTCASADVLQLLQFTAAGYTAEQTCNLLWTGAEHGFPLDAQLLNATGGTGGVSACTNPSSNTPASCSGGYAKPFWQNGTGVPADSKRDVPDISLFASAGELNSAYVFCDSELGPCNFSNATDAIGQGVGGTSVSSPAMAGIMALVLQKIGGTAQGLANPVFYQLASQENLASCNSGSVSIGNSCFFYDITSDTIRVPCATGSPNCATGTAGDAVGILSGYDATTGYDLASGLGSVNVTNLVNGWVSTGAFGVAPNQLSFGSQLVNTTSSMQAISLSNHLNMPVSLTSITASTNWSQTNNCGSSLASQTTCTINVSFKPTLSGVLSGSIIIQASQGTISVSLSGNGIAPAVAFSAPSITFASQTVGILSSPQTIDLENTGTATLNGISISITGANASDFTQGTSCGTTLVAGSYCPISIEFTPGGTGARSATLSVADNASGSPQTVPISGTGTTATTTSALQFIAITPCRVADTRNSTGAFGGPELAAGSTRTFNIPQSACSIPATAVAYSLNATVVPSGQLGYLTLWPAGQTQPLVSTLNSDGRIKANAAIVPAGTNGGVSVYVTDATNFILDIDGYFAPAGTASALAFYPVTPCRIADTRNSAGPLGGPTLSGGTSRDFPMLSSSCNIPSTAQAYSLNVTAVPHGPLNYLTAWPTGTAQPNVSTLNASTGAVTANAAIVPAGTGGDISIFVYNDADVILDVNGYFAPPASGGLSLYTVTPCRVIDTRYGAGAFQGTLAVPVQTSSCAPPATAQAYVMNATVVPPGSLNYLSLWPDGAAQPYVSTLNANDGAITSNMAIVPTTNGKVDSYAYNPTNLILDLSSYFAP